MVDVQTITTNGAATLIRREVLSNCARTFEDSVYPWSANQRVQTKDVGVIFSKRQGFDVYM